MLYSTPTLLPFSSPMLPLKREKNVLSDITANADLAIPQPVTCLDIHHIESQRLGKQLLQFTRRDVADDLLRMT